jgi:hypothetical protein
MNKQLYFILATLLLFGCGTQKESEMIGEWTAVPHNTPWGELTGTLSLRPDGTCTLRLYPTDEPEASPLLEEGSWLASGETNATITWQQSEPGDTIRVALLNATALKLSAEDVVVTFKKRE